MMGSIETSGESRMNVSFESNDDESVEINLLPAHTKCIDQRSNSSNNNTSSAPNGSQMVNSLPKRYPNEDASEIEEKKDSELYPTLMMKNAAPLTRSGTPPPAMLSFSDSSRCLTPDQVLSEARAELAKTSTRSRRVNCMQQHQHNLTQNERTQQILQTARMHASNKKRESSQHQQLRSAQDVLRMAVEVPPTPENQVLTTTNDLLQLDSSTSSLSGPPKNNQDSHLGTSRTIPSLDSLLKGKEPIARCRSPTSDCSMNSMDDFELAVRGLPSKLSDPLNDSGLTRENMLDRIDGLGADDDSNQLLHESQETEDDIILVSPAGVKNEGSAASVAAGTTSFSYYMDYFLGGSSSGGNPCLGSDKDTQEPFSAEGEKGGAPDSSTYAQKASSLKAFSPLACGAIQSARDVMTGNIRDTNSCMASNDPHRTGTIGADTPAENINEVDPRMPSWIDAISSKQNTDAGSLSKYFYALGKSRTIIVHEIVRGNWTWCTAWSPDGSRLAIATENHHLAVVDSSASTVWRVRHDQRITKPIRNHTTHSIRSIAWGSQFIAIGGTGDAVSILSPIEPYPIVHTIRGTGFVGSLDWRLNSTVLAVGSRADKCSLYNISTAEDEAGGEGGAFRRIVSQELYTITRKDWANAVSFSPGGSVLAVGDNSGKLSVYSFESSFTEAPKLEKITNFKFDAAILDVEWSPDGLWLYAGGKDFAMTIIETCTWQVKQRIPRDRWMHFAASSSRGTHVAVGGGKAQVTILDALDEWKPALSIELKGLVPLSAKWHPRDQYLAITGQDNSIIAIETTNARHIKGHYLQSISPIVEVEFSPDGQILAVGNEAGVVSFYRSDGSSFVTAYEIVLADGSQQSIIWSPNGSYVMVGSGDTLAIIGQATASEMNHGVVPPRTSGLAIQKVIRDVDSIFSIAIHRSSRYAALVGESISILDAANDFHYVKRWENVGGAAVKACAWSSDGSWLATTGLSGKMVLYDTSNPSVTSWKEFFTVDCEDANNALAWGPSVVDGLQYLAYGGNNQTVTIIEIRTLEGTWETVLEVSRKGSINDLDWSDSGLLAAAVGDGTVTIIDLAYLKSGCAVNQMDYNWQRQGITCFTEIRRNQGTNSMSTIRWIPSQASEESVLAIGGSDGALEVIDLTERSRCKGFGNATATNSTNASHHQQGYHHVA